MIMMHIKLSHVQPNTKGTHPLHQFFKIKFIETQGDLHSQIDVVN